MVMIGKRQDLTPFFDPVLCVNIDRLTGKIILLTIRAVCRLSFGFCRLVLSAFQQSEWALRFRNT